MRLVRAEGLTTVLNLHDVTVAQRVADRVVGMRGGRMIFDRPVVDVTDDDLTDLYRDTDRQGASA